MRTVLLTAIRGYQRFVSPHKGFRCAHRVHLGGASCSTFGYRAVRRFGAIGGLHLLRARARRCGDIHRAHHGERSPEVRALQRGFCDCDCISPCDLATCDLAACDVSDCDCSGCDGPGRESKPSAKKPSLRDRAAASVRDGPDAGHSTWPGS